MIDFSEHETTQFCWKNIENPLMISEMIAATNILIYMSFSSFHENRTKEKDDMSPKNQTKTKKKNLVWNLRRTSLSMMKHVMVRCLHFFQEPQI